jgi:hypothetical protein
VKQGFRSIVVALAIAVVVGGASASAQSTAIVKIDFAFLAGGKSMPAGSYTIERTPVGALVLRPRQAGPNSPLLPPITRLGRHDKDDVAELVFDKTEAGLQLSEIWLPREDGYLLLATSKEHQHQVVNGEIKK